MPDKVPLPKLEDMSMDDALKRALIDGGQNPDDLGKKSAPKPPPRTGGSSGTPTRTARRNRSLKAELIQYYAMLATASMMIPNKPRIGLMIMNQADACAEALDELAATNNKVHAALVKMMTAGAMTAVISAHAPILLAIAAETVAPQLVPLVDSQLDADE